MPLMAQAPKIVLLDVYETMLDMSDLERRINDLLGSKRGYTLWFELFLQYCFVDNSLEQFHDFPSIARATMRMAAGMLGRKPDSEDLDYMIELLRHLPVHEGVQPGLSALYDAGYRIAALTNSPEATVRDRMDRTGLVSYFELVLSAEQVRRYKPAKSVYDYAAAKLKASPADILMVSAHGWDLAGAANAGMQTAYLKQNKQLLYPLAPEPDYTCSSLPDLAAQLGALREEE